MGVCGVDDDEFAAEMVRLDGFPDGHPVLGRVGEVLGLSVPVRCPEWDQDRPPSNFRYAAVQAGVPVAVHVLPLGDAATDGVRVGMARDRVSLVARIDSPHVTAVRSPVEVLPGSPGALCWAEETPLADPFDAGGGPETTWTVAQARQLLSEVATGVACFHALAERAWPRLGGIGRRPTGDFVLTNDPLVSALGTARVAGPPVRDLGLPYFCSPEDLLGGSPSLASDVHTLGVLTFLVLTAMLPLTAQNGRPPGEPDLSTAAVSDYVARLPHTQVPPVQSVRPDVPDGLATVIDRCLRPRAVDRYPDAPTLLTALNVPPAAE